MPIDSSVVDLTRDELREVTEYAALPIFEGEVPSDARPREAIEAAHLRLGSPRSALTV